MSRFEDINNRMHNDALMNDEFMNFIDTHFSELEIFLLQQGTMELVWIWKAWLDVKNSSGEDERQVDYVLSQQIMNTKKSFSRMHKSEKKAVLNKLVTKILPFNFNQNDCVIFSCKTIPTKTNIENRKKLEKKLLAKKLRIFTDVHVSGHAAREDQRELIKMIKPRNIVPAHGDQKMAKALAELAEEMGYKIGKTVYVMKDGQRVKL